MGQFLNFLQFFQVKSAVLRGRRDVIVGDVTSRYPQNDSGVARNLQAKLSSVTSHRTYPHNDPGVVRNLQAKFGADRTVPKFPTIF
jgi:hypothetical protein